MSDQLPFRRFDEIDAQAYDLGFEMARRAATWLVEVARPAPASRVIDVACGTGFATFRLAAAVGEDGHVLGVDLSERMIEVARSQASRAELTNVEFIRCEGAKLDVTRDSVDLVTCASALFGFPDIGAALENWREALRPGGAVAFSSFTGETPGAYAWPELNEVLIRHVGSVERLRRPPNLRSVEACRSVVRDAGFVDVECRQDDRGYYYADFDALWAEMTGSLFTLRLEGYDEGKVDRLKSELMEAVAPRFRQGPQYRANEVIVTTARNPE